MIGHICRYLEEDAPLVLVTVARQQGSAPRSAGARMLVGEQGLLCGSVGGGVLEARALEGAAQSLATGRSIWTDFDLSGEMAAGSDMICGGHVRLFVEYLPADAATRQLYARLRAALAQGRACCMVTPVSRPQARFLMVEGEPLPPHMPAPLRDLPGKSFPRTPQALGTEGDEVLVSPWDTATALIIAGGGHVGQCTCRVAALAHFSVTVLDDREEFARPARFPHAAAVRVTPDFARCFAAENITPLTHIAIMTRGHMHDAAVLAQALRTPAGYVGMIGSRRKRDAVYAQLRTQGFAEADLARVYSPIGLSIRAETPEEIAVSIVAELIASRAMLLRTAGN